VLIGTPIDLGSLMKINKPTLRVTYELGESAKVALRKEIKRIL
jgi:predicted GTPase